MIRENKEMVILELGKSFETCQPEDEAAADDDTKRVPSTASCTRLE